MDSSTWQPAGTAHTAHYTTTAMRSAQDLLNSASAFCQQVQVRSTNKRTQKGPGIVKPSIKASGISGRAPCPKQARTTRLLRHRLSRDDSEHSAVRLKAPLGKAGVPDLVGSAYGKTACCLLHVLQGGLADVLQSLAFDARHFWLRLKKAAT